MIIFGLFLIKKFQCFAVTIYYLHYIIYLEINFNLVKTIDINLS